MEEAKVIVKLDNVYKVTKLQVPVSDIDFEAELSIFWSAIKGIKPENIILEYFNEKNESVRMTLRDAGASDALKTIRAVCVVGGCILNSRNDADSDTLRRLACLGHYTPTQLLAGRGKIFSNTGRDLRIDCEATWCLQEELLKK
jgi:hypothetical protein